MCLPSEARLREIAAGFRVSGIGKSLGMHYVAYLDEYGHVGQYVSRDHPSPITKMAAPRNEKTRRLGGFFLGVKRTR